MYLLTPNGLTIIINALHVAADVYKRDCAPACAEGASHLVQQFIRQAEEALALADALEDADGITMTP